MNPLARFAAGGPVPVFPAVGAGGRDPAEDLALAPGLRPVVSPRHASLLLVAGEIPAEHREALDRVHDQVPHPRATLSWKIPTPGGEGPRDLEGRRDAGAPQDEDAAPEPGEKPHAPRPPAAEARRLYRSLLAGERESEPHRLPDEPPAPWRGEGDHGQGGKGMMGGKPYGRPMAMTGPDLRDGLALDRVPFTVGPFLPALPPGMVLRVMLQGDVVQEAEVVSAPYPQPLPEPFRHALRGQPVALASLELARAAALLRSVHRTLRLLGSAAMADRLLGTLVHPAEAAAANADGAERPPTPHPDPVPSAGDLSRRLDRFRRLLRRTGVFLALPPGLGPLGRERAVGLGGPCARAAGGQVDPRATAEIYRDLGFQPLPARGDGVRERLLQRLDEAEQALALAGRAAAGGSERGSERLLPPTGSSGGIAGAALEGPEGELSLPGGASGREEFFRQALPHLLPGLEWRRAMLVVASLEPVPAMEAPPTPGRSA